MSGFIGAAIGAGAGVALGGAFGMTGGGDIGSGMVSGGMSGAISGAIIGSAVARGGPINNMLRGMGGIADDLLGNESAKGYMKALERTRTHDDTVNSLTNRFTKLSEDLGADDADFVKLSQRMTEDFGIDTSKAGGLDDLKKLSATEKTAALQRLEDANIADMKTVSEGISDTGSFADRAYNLGASGEKDMASIAMSNISRYNKLLGEGVEGNLPTISKMEADLGAGLVADLKSGMSAQDLMKGDAFKSYAGGLKTNVNSRNANLMFAGSGLTASIMGYQSGKRSSKRRGLNRNRGARF